jgi:hypothetical protein
MMFLAQTGPKTAKPQKYTTDTFPRAHTITKTPNYKTTETQNMTQYYKIMRFAHYFVLVYIVVYFGGFVIWCFCNSRALGNVSVLYFWGFFSFRACLGQGTS